MWRNPELWDNVLRVSIDDDIQQQEKLSNLTVEEVTARLQNCVFCQLGTFASILQSFKVDFNFAGEIISSYAFKYQLSNSDFDTLEAILNKCYAIPSSKADPATRSQTESQAVRSDPASTLYFEGSETADISEKQNEEHTAPTEDRAKYEEELRQRIPKAQNPPISPHYEQVLQEISVEEVKEEEPRTEFKEGVKLESNL